MTKVSIINKVPLKDFTEEAYLNYSMYVILDRALPNLSDGLKPVQRRILYAMNELSLTHNSKYKKSARTIGDVLGKFHPHGDTACYEAMVMLAQPFTFNYPLIDGQGNWGTQDDPKSFAAMRYTESRLTNFSNLLLDDINMGTVQWSSNFDGTLQEPKILPSQIPNILINGGSGIAVGMSTDIPPHNLNEVVDVTKKLLRDPKISVNEIKKILSGPDFPTGGEIILNNSEIDTIYEEGHGNIKLRATSKIKGKEIVINSIPYQSSISKIIEQIQEQIYAKKINFIDSVVDMSDQENPVRIIIKIKGRGLDYSEIMQHLYYTTDLEKSFRVNLNMIGLDGKPQVKGIRKILLEWLDFRKITLKNKLSWRLDKILERIHILEGFVKAYKGLDKILKIIRNEDNPKPKLIKIYKFTNKQYDAVINLKIRNLAKLEEQMIKKELKSLREEELEITSTLKSTKKLNNLITIGLDTINKTYGRDRLTKIIQAESSKPIKIIPIINNEPVTVLISKNGWIKSIKGHEANLKQINYKTDDIYFSHLETYLDKKISFLDQNGYVYSLDVNTVPSSRGYGEPLSKFFNLKDGVSIVGVANIDEDQNVLAISDIGYGFICKHSDIFVKNRTGKTLIKVSGTKAFSFINLNRKTHKYYILITTDNYMIIGKINEIPILSKGKGVKLVNIPKNNKENINYVNVLTSEQLGQLPPEYVMKRTRRGRKIDKKLLKTINKLFYNIT